VKVLHILNELMPSGAEMALRVAAPHWCAMGLECHVLSTGERPGIYADTLRQAGYRMHHLPFEKSPVFFKTLYRLLRNNRFDVVHIHTERGNFYYALTARAAGNRNIVRTIHSVFKFTGHTWMARRIQRGMLRWMGVQQVSIGLSVAENELLRYGNPTRQIFNWCSDHFQPANGLENARDLRRKLNIAMHQFVVVSVGNCSTVKNHGELMRALAMLKKQHEFLYIHIGREKRGAPERCLALELGIAEHTRFLGFIDDPLHYLQVADAYVMPSIYEGFGIAAIEAMAAGAPAVLANVPGLRDIKRYSDAPIWVTPKDETILAGLKKIAVMTLEERMRLGLRGSYAVRKHFSMTRGAQSYANIYMKEFVKHPKG
jgi:glycosyltransferase involved in cell wall biosynthesis